jgi:hypothetical protein
MAFPARVALISALMGLWPAAAQAQATPPTDPSAQPAPAPAPADTAAPAASAPPTVVPATGYGWSVTPKKAGPGHTTRGRLRAARVMNQTPDAILPGFETLADGSTRLFVELSRPVEYVAKPAQGTLTFVLKGAHVDRRNNYNPLVTVHFNTPVSSARLVPHGRDLWFVVDLRARVSPSVTMDAAKDGGAMLRIEFPKGDYLPGQVGTPRDVPASATTPEHATTAAPAATTPPVVH